MSETTSVSKGCFAFKGKKTGAKSENLLNLKSESSARQFRVFQNIWEQMHLTIQRLQSDVNSQLFQDLLAFVKTCHENFCLGESGASNEKEFRELPAAALVTGVNTPDHAVMFPSLLDLLKGITPLVVSLSSEDCISLKAIIKLVLYELMEQPCLVDEDGEINIKQLPCTLNTLADWYSKKYQLVNAAPKKKKKTEKSKRHKVTRYPNVVVIFEDLEALTPRVLQDFISISSTYLHQIPFVLVFGIATSVMTVHRSLPRVVSSLLRIETFQAPLSSSYMTHVLNMILMTPENPFKLGPKVFQYLLDIFLYHDFSVLNFVKGLQFVMMEHYYSNSLSFLCCFPDKLKDHAKFLCHSSLEMIRHTPSFMKFVETCPPNLQKDLLLNDDVLKEETVKLIQALHTYHKLFFPVFCCLHTLVGKLPKYPLGKQMREVYALCLQDFLCDTEPYKQAIHLLRFLAKDELVLLLSQCVDSLVSWELEDELLTVSETLKNILERFQNLEDSAETEDEADRQKDFPLLKRTNIHSLRQTLQEMEKKKKKFSPFEKLREKTIDYLDDIFRKYLCCPKSCPLHEIFYYDNIGVVREHLTASPRAVVQKALSDPHSCLQCACCKVDSGSILPSMPDTCVAYKLHLECGRLINLYDWLQSFVTVVSEDEENHKEQKPSKALQARFIRAVSELQFLGFIKPTQQKTDHVARLTWGRC